MNVAYVKCDRCSAQTPADDAGRYGRFCGGLLDIAYETKE